MSIPLRTSEISVRVVLWCAALMLPAVSAGISVPHGPYILIPALAAYDRVSVRRVALWTMLTALYEIVYRIPYGTLAVPVLILAAGVSLAAHLVRTETLSAARGWSPVPVLRALVSAVAWAAGMVVLSALFGAVTSGEPLPGYRLLNVWAGTAAWSLIAGIGISLAVLHRSRVPFRRPIIFGT